LKSYDATLVTPPTDCYPDKLFLLVKGIRDIKRAEARRCRRGVTVFVDFWHTVEFSRIRRAPSPIDFS